MSSVWNFYARSSDAVADPDRQISGGPGLKFRHFGPQFGLAERGGGAGAGHWATVPWPRERVLKTEWDLGARLSRITLLAGPTFLYRNKHFCSLGQGETIWACASAVVSSWLGQRGQLLSHINARLSWLSWESGGHLSRDQRCLPSCHFMGKPGDSVKCWLFSQETIFIRWVLKEIQTLLRCLLLVLTVANINSLLSISIHHQKVVRINKMVTTETYFDQLNN